MVIGNKVTSPGDAIIIKLVQPYKLVKEVISYEDETIGEDSSNYFKKWFRWSTDNVQYSDYIPLTNLNLQRLELNPANDFWIEYKYVAEELETGKEIEFVSIALEVVTKSGRLQQVVQVTTGACDASDQNCIGNLIVEECCETDNLFKPYSLLNNANCLYDQLTLLATKIFGHCVRYYRAEPDKNSDDVILREYSIFNRSTVKEIQVLVPDNDFPANDFQFDPFDGMGFEGFEIHITRQEFEEAFGPKARPRERDALFFTINQRMYTVNSVALADEINALHTYYKVKLRKFEDSKNIQNTPEIEQELDELVTNMDEVVGEQTKDEYLKFTKPQEYKTIGLGKNDYVRSDLNAEISIADEKINNNWTIVSKNYYDLSKLGNGVIAAKYHEMAKLTKEEDRAFTFWFRSKFAKSKPKINISGFSNNNGNLQITTSSATGYKVGDSVEVYDSVEYQYNIYKVIAVIDDYNFVLDVQYDSAAIATGTKVRLKEVATLLYGYNLTNPTSNGMLVQVYKDYVVVNINNVDYSFKLDLDEFSTDVWYSMVINMSNKFKQLSLHFYKLEKSQTYTMPQNEDTSLDLIKYESKLLDDNIEFDSGDKWALLGGPIQLTNIRIFKSIMEEEAQQAVLNQYVVRDTHLALLIDNAIPRIHLMKMENSR